jgi:hypothetical protein
LGEEDTYQRIVMFRDHIHWVTPITRDPIPWPFQAERYQETVEGIKGNLCQGMSIHLAAFLQAYGYRFRHVELWMDKYTAEGIPISHSVLEVWVNGRWEIHDTTYNCVWELDDGIPLSVAEMDAAIAAGKTPIPDTQGFERREELPLDLDYYYDYFSHHKVHLHGSFLLRMGTIDTREKSCPLYYFFK